MLIIFRSKYCQGLLKKNIKFMIWVVSQILNWKAVHKKIVLKAKSHMSFIRPVALLTQHKCICFKLLWLPLFAFASIGAAIICSDVTRLRVCLQFSYRHSRENHTISNRKSVHHKSRDSREILPYHWREAASNSQALINEWTMVSMVTHWTL